MTGGAVQCMFVLKMTTALFDETFGNLSIRYGLYLTAEVFHYTPAVEA
jgi:hypothetical protein